MMSQLSDEEKASWIDPRGPDGVTILAPYEQAKPNQHPGLLTGDPPRKMMLFDLENDRAEQHDVAAQHPDVVERLSAMFEETQSSMAAWPEPESAYLFRLPKRRTAAYATRRR